MNKGLVWHSLLRFVLQYGKNDEDLLSMDANHINRRGGPWGLVLNHYMDDEFGADLQGKIKRENKLKGLIHFHSFYRSLQTNNCSQTFNISLHTELTQFCVPENNGTLAHARTTLWLNWKEKNLSCIAHVRNQFFLWVGAFWSRLVATTSVCFRLPFIGGHRIDESICVVIMIHSVEVLDIRLTIRLFQQNNKR